MISIIINWILRINMESFPKSSTNNLCNHRIDDWNYIWKNITNLLSNDWLDKFVDIYPKLNHWICNDWLWLVMNHYTDKDEYMYGNKVNEWFIIPYKEVKLLTQPKGKFGNNHTLGLPNFSSPKWRENILSLLHN